MLLKSPGEAIAATEGPGGRRTGPGGVSRPA